MKYLTLFATLVASQVQSCDPYVIEDNTTRTHIYEMKLDFQKENPTIAFCHLHQQMESVLLRTHDIQDVEGENMVIEKVLQLFVRVINTQLLKRIDLEDFKSKNVQNANETR